MVISKSWGVNVVFLGVDGGGTRTRAVVANEDGEVIGVGFGGPANYNDVDRDTFKRSIENAVKGTAFRGVFEKAVFGIAGVGVWGERVKELKEMILEIVDAKHVEITTDAVIALKGALGNDPGVVILAGTGSTVMGIDARGGYHRIGGWGYLFGDPGGGYGIALDALKEVMRYWESRGKETILVDEVRRFFGFSSVVDVLKHLYTSKKFKEEVASFARKVIECAESGDAVAMEIVERNVEELVSGVKALVNVVESDTISYSGGLFKSDYFKDLVSEKLKEFGLELKDPKLPPVGGALLLAVGKADEAILKKLASELSGL